MAPECPREAQGPLVARRPVVDLWAEPAEGVERVSQVLLGMPLTPIASEGGYLYVEGPDLYRGWVRREDTAPALAPAGEPRVVGALDAGVYAGPAAPDLLMRIFFGTVLPTAEAAGDRVRVLLPEGDGWVPAACLRPVPREGAPLDIDALLEDARRFLGVPYLWGGNSPLGIDCSGFVQLIFRMHGRSLLRDCDLQTRHGRPVPLEAVGAGDLIFFGSSPEGMPTHVGIAVSAVEYNHAHGSEGHCVSISPLSGALSTVWGVRRVE